MAKFEIPEIKNYGMATMGERGQIVIPKEIRKMMKIKAGEKLLVFSKGSSLVGFIKPEEFDKLISKFTKQLLDLKNIH